MSRVWNHMLKATLTFCLLVLPVGGNVAECAACCSDESEACCESKASSTCCGEGSSCCEDNSPSCCSGEAQNLSCVCCEPNDSPPKVPSPSRPTAPPSSKVLGLQVFAFGRLLEQPPMRRALEQSSPGFTSPNACRVSICVWLT